MNRPVEWVLSFVGERITALLPTRSAPRQSRQVRRQENEPSALLELLFAGRAPVQSAIGLIRSLVALGAPIDLDDAVEYLVQADAGRSRSGATTLLLAVEPDSDGYLRRPDEAKTLLREYALTERAVAWDIVNALGSRGFFAFEDVAREIAKALDEDASG
jgi:hypothetical protein